jgi:hypothetical protein
LRRKLSNSEQVGGVESAHRGGGGQGSGLSKRCECVLHRRGCRANLARDRGDDGHRPNALFHGGMVEAGLVAAGQEGLALVVLRVIVGTFVGHQRGRVGMAWNLRG